MEGESQVFNALDDFWNAESCAKTANGLGRFFHYGLNIETPDEFYQEMLAYTLADSVLENM